MSARDVTKESRDNRLTIWIFIVALSIGGAERTIVDLVNGMDSERFEVEVWTVFDTNPLVDRLDETVTHRCLDVAAKKGENSHEITGAADPSMYVRAPFRFLAAVYREQPDAVHSFLFYGNIICRVAGLVSPGTAVINGERGFHNCPRKELHLVDRLTLPLADVIVSNSRAGAEHYLDRGVQWKNLRVIPNGRQLEVYRDASPAEIRSEFGIPQDALVVGTVGRLVERKGHTDLLRAWERIRDSVPDSHLVIVGYGPDRDVLEALSAELTVASSVHFAGSREDVPELLAAMDLFVFPSHWEGHPGALLEAMATGLPIVATRVDGNSDLVTDEQTGLLVPPRDPVALGNAIHRLCTDRDLASTLGDRAQDEAFSEYTLDAMVDRFEAVYHEHTMSLSKP